MIVSPSPNLLSFNCPHCKVLAQQFWWSARSAKYDKDQHPKIYNPEEAEERVKEFEKDNKIPAETVTMLSTWIRRLGTGAVSFSEKSDSTWSHSVENLHFSKCYHCEKIAVWIHGRLVHPAGYDAPAANSDMPEDVLREYNEAAAIAPQSARGAAALLRLALQRLMPHLGQKGRDLNNDIAALVKNGLDPRIQRSLDIVRVTGNNAVHPGQIAFEDNPETVATLFKLTNVIVDVLISQPKHIEEAYGGLPQPAKEAIEKRDQKS